MASDLFRALLGANNRLIGTVERRRYRKCPPRGIVTERTMVVRTGREASCRLTVDDGVRFGYVDVDPERFLDEFGIGDEVVVDDIRYAPKGDPKGDRR